MGRPMVQIKNTILFFSVCFVVLWVFLCLCSDVFADIKGNHQSFSYYILGLNQELLGDQANAILAYEKALQKDREALPVHRRLAMMYFQENNIEKALEELNFILKKDSEDQVIRYILAVTQASLGYVEKAIKGYEIILNKEVPENMNIEQIYEELGALYLKNRESLKAMEAFKKVLTVNPENTDVAYALGAYYGSSKERVNAIPFFKQCIKADPFHTLCLNGLGYVYAQENMALEEAEKLIQRALEILPEEGAFLDSLGWVYYQQGKYFDALKYLLLAADVVEDPVIDQHLADVYFKLGRKDLAQYYWKKSQDFYLEYHPVRLKMPSM